MVMAVTVGSVVVRTNFEELQISVVFSELCEMGNFSRPTVNFKVERGL